MDRSSIHVSAATRRRLARYRPPNASYEEVLRAFMDAVEPGEFVRRFREAHDRAMREAWRPERDQARAAEAGRRHREHDLEAATPGERMERAFLLHELARGG